MANSHFALRIARNTLIVVLPDQPPGESSSPAHTANLDNLRAPAGDQLPVLLPGIRAEEQRARTG
eukprot:8655186-Pyramimonas_sp.AAC.1